MSPSKDVFCTRKYLGVYMLKLVIIMISAVYLSGCCSFVVDFKTDLTVVADIDGKNVSIGHIYVGEKEKARLAEYAPMIYEDDDMKVEIYLFNKTSSFTFYNKANTDIVFLFNRASIASQASNIHKPLRAKYFTENVMPDHLTFTKSHSNYVQLSPLLIQAGQSAAVRFRPDFDGLYYINSYFGLDIRGDTTEEVNINARKSAVGKQLFLYLPVLVEEQEIHYKFHFMVTEVSTRTSCS